MDLQYSKDPEENIKQRIILLEKAASDPKTQAAILKQCEVDPLFCINMFCWTYDPRLPCNNDIPFLTYEFQDDHILALIKDIEDGHDNATEKSRDMGASWMAVALQTWAWRFKRWSSLYGSYKEDYVDSQGNMDSHFERIRYVIAKWPLWMKPDDILVKYMNVSSKELGCDIAGDIGMNFGTGGRRKFVILDEFALWQYDETAFRKTRDVTRCRIFQGTPEGRFNVYGKLMTNHVDYAHLNIHRFRLHWSLHPHKDEAWYESEKAGRTKLDIAKELDISYDESVTGAVYKDFGQLAKFGEYTFDPTRFLYCSWDFGLDMTAIIWFQKDFDTDSLYIIDAYQKEDMPIEFFAAFVNGEPIQGYVYDQKELDMVEEHGIWKKKMTNHFGDPYNIDNRNVASKGESVGDTIRSVLALNGIHLKTNRQSTVQSRIQTATLAMKKMYVNDKLHDFKQAIMQARYPQSSERSNATSVVSKPVHDATSHFRTALEYFCDNEPKKVSSKAPKLKKREVFNHITGEAFKEPKKKFMI